MLQLRNRKRHGVEVVWTASTLPRKTVFARIAAELSDCAADVTPLREKPIHRAQDASGRIHVGVAAHITTVRVKRSMRYSDRGLRRR
jgi:hypothetical protein